MNKLINIPEMTFKIIGTYAITIIAAGLLAIISAYLVGGNGFSVYLIMMSLFWVYWLIINLQEYERKEPLERYPF